MNALENKIPPPIVTLSCAIAMWFISKPNGQITSLDSTPLLQIFIGALLFFIGCLYIIAGFMAFRSEKTTVNPLRPETASSLVISGIYRNTRNPMYLGLLFYLLGWGSYLGSIPSLLFIGFFVLFMNRFQIKPEERAMESLFGKEYLEYKSSVRRWL